MAKVYIGVGHGGWETGAYANGIKEKDVNLTIALACNEVLVRHGVKTLMSRTKDEEDTLRQEINECNAFDPDLAADIHNNAGGGDGAEVFHSVVGGTGKVMATNILNEIVALGQNSRGVKTRKEDDGSDWYGFIRETKAPAVIVECAFLDNKKDVQIIDTEAERKAMGVAIAKGILKTLNIAYVPEKKPSKPVVDTMATVQLRVLRQGMTGNDVRQAMLALKDRGYYKAIIPKSDKEFGPKMYAATVAFQKAEKIDADGIIGADTWTHLLEK